MIHFIETRPKPKVIFEIGCGNLNETRSSYLWEHEDIDFYLFEPNREFYDELLKVAGKRKNVHIYNCAILDKECDVNLINHGSCGYIDGYEGAPVLIASPELNRDRDSKKQPIKAFPLSNFDRGDIDVLYIDTEGTEWQVLQTLISKPTVINVEMEVNSSKNPHFNEILGWAKNNGYQFSICGNDYIFFNNSLRIIKMGN